MRAIRMEGYGDPEVMQLAEAPMPEPGVGEVRIKVVAAGVNPADWQWRSGLLAKSMPLSFPHTPGYDLAGVVDKLGEGVTGFAVGGRVCGTTSRAQGSYAEYALVPAGSLAPIPDTLDFATAAALPTPALTGVQLIEDVVRPKSGQLVLVTGAVGGVGRFSVYAARRLGARVVAAVRERQADEALALGCEAVVALDGGQWTGEPFDGVADTLGGPEVARLCRHLKPGATLGTVTINPIAPEGLPSKPVFMVLHGDGRRLADLVRAVARGDITAPVALRLPLAEAAKAHRLLQAGGIRGKIVLEP
jgi:NADPH:quinone reductase-like Zn-dependent oxidoreductase